MMRADGLAGLAGEVGVAVAAEAVPVDWVVVKGRVAAADQLVLLVAGVAAEAAEQRPAGTAVARHWRAADGARLPREVRVTVAAEIYPIRGVVVEGRVAGADLLVLRPASVAGEGAHRSPVAAA